MKIYTKQIGIQTSLIDLKNTVVCVVGAGYVGLPLAEAFARHLKTISYDIDKKKVTYLSRVNKNLNHTFSSNPEDISKADFIAVCVPTPITKSKDPDMSYVRAAATTVGQNMKKGALVILESSVYPGVTEEVVKPILEKESGYKYGIDFRVAYSPERINPGDIEHNVDKVTKIVSADNPQTLRIMVKLYSNVTLKIFQAKDIKTAEAAKLVENTQRDLNIALVNELSIIFEKMGLNTNDVLEAAATKWNFQKFSPGLVGGYCIPVVPYFLVHKAEEYGYHSRIILAGRAVNDHMPKYIAEMAIKCINSVGKVISGSKVLIMGCTYKENVEDTRESPVKDVIKELHEYNVDVYGYDPVAKDPEKNLGINFIKDLANSPMMDCIIVTVFHKSFEGITIHSLKAIMNHHPVLIDLRGVFDSQETEDAGFTYRRL